MMVLLVKRSSYLQVPGSTFKVSNKIRMELQILLNQAEYAQHDEIGSRHG